MLGEVKAIERVGVSSHRLDLNRGTGAIDGHHEVQFATADANVATFHDGAARFQEVSCDVFAELSEASRAQIWMDGSSSSMFTSRKLKTWTFLRKRAGRYMSQTQASLRVSSK